MTDIPQNKVLFSGVRIAKDVVEDTRDWLSVEAPLEIHINGTPFTVTMRTPGDDPFLVKGLLFSEGVVRGEGLHYAYRSYLDPTHETNTIADVTIPEVFVCDEMLGKRSLLSSSSCGVCGTREWADIEVHAQAVRKGSRLRVDRLPIMAERMETQQSAFRATGGCHAAAVFSNDGDLITLFEDIGRHNAVDKVIGYLLEEDLLETADVLFVSGRVSFEIVAKACRAGISFLAGVSAPSSLAVDIADAHGMTLMGFCRDGRATVYSHPDRVLHPKTRGG